MAGEKKKMAGGTVEVEASKKSASKAKTPKQLKPEPKITKKLPNQSNAKESNRPQNTQVNVVNSGDRSKEKNSSSKKEINRGQVKDRRDARNKDIDGMIFMCNAKTKSDCFRYMVMGLPESKKEIVAIIRPGFKLFLFDFDAKLLYGIYKATSVGGMKLEPDAFSGSYPAQVRFKVLAECSPLSEGAFRRAIMGSSGGDKIKFDVELTSQQVKKLTSLFQSNGNPPILNPQPVPIPLVHLRPVTDALLINPRQKERTPVRGETTTVSYDPLSFGEKEYRMFGLKRRQPAAVSEAPVPYVAPETAHGDRDVHDYPLPSMRAGYPSGMDYHRQTDHLSRGRVHESEYKRPAVEAEQLAAQLTSYRGGYPYEVEYGEPSRLHSAHAANALSDYNNMIYQQQQQPPPPRTKEDDRHGALPVSSRYSFAGPSYR